MAGQPQSLWAGTPAVQGSEPVPVMLSLEVLEGKARKLTSAESQHMNSTDFVEQKGSLLLCCGSGNTWLQLQCIPGQRCSGFPF